MNFLSASPCLLTKSLAIGFGDCCNPDDPISRSLVYLPRHFSRKAHIHRLWITDVLLEGHNSTHYADRSGRTNIQNPLRPCLFHLFPTFPKALCVLFPHNSACGKVLNGAFIWSPNGKQLKTRPWRNTDLQLHRINSPKSLPLRGAQWIFHSIKGWIVHLP